MDKGIDLSLLTMIKRFKFLNPFMNSRCLESGVSPTIVKNIQQLLGKGRIYFAFRMDQSVNPIRRVSKLFHIVCLITILPWWKQVSHLCLLILILIQRPLEAHRKCFVDVNNKCWSVQGGCEFMTLCWKRLVVHSNISVK